MLIVFSPFYNNAIPDDPRRPNHQSAGFFEVTARASVTQQPTVDWGRSFGSTFQMQHSISAQHSTAQCILVKRMASCCTMLVFWGWCILETAGAQAHVQNEQSIFQRV
jgi:hypothetical protein|uniref:Uncharacterized protein n=1 Tax=Eutreptiella gymnastica TaxID=73025 RepID=A0A7S4FE31_9EUGL|mmetsp:Transcript_51949/g.86571  ORF Transcript_51949/g.86571 Transcript_51949/m.86571 type:complete len:108 (-) Transcript_51949:670-993(-)